MDQELKQRLIGAVVITALAAIFVPMLFDDPVDEVGKNINTLKLPEIPAKVQDVEIVPLPEKSEDVAPSGLTAPTESSLKSLASNEESAPTEVDVEARKPKLRLSSRDKEAGAVAAKHLHAVEPDAGDDDPAMSAAEDIAPPPKAPKLPAQQLTQTMPPKPLKTPVKPVETQLTEPTVSKQPTAPSANPVGTRWYLNAGSFSQKNNALTMLDNLKQQGFAASLKEVNGEKGTVYKVRVGPMLDKLQVQTVKNKLTQINVNTFVSPDD